MQEEFSEDDLDMFWPYYKTYLVEILNGEYDLDTAREDLRSLINRVQDDQGNLK